MRLRSGLRAGASRTDISPGGMYGAVVGFASAIGLILGKENQWAGS